MEFRSFRGTLVGMVEHLVLVTCCALAAAACYSVSDVVEQRKASLAPPESSLKLALLWHLAKQPIWWLAIAVDLGGFGLQALALGMGRVVFVQPILLMNLPISLILGHRIGSHRLVRRDLAWALVYVAALSFFLIVGDPAGGVAVRSLRAWIVPLVIIGTTTVVTIAVSGFANRAWRSLLLGVAAGTLFGLTTALTKSFSHLLGHDGWRVLLHWELYAMVGAGLLALISMQSAFHVGDLRTSLPAVDLAEPVVGGLLGIILLHERLQASGMVEITAMVASVGVMVMATIGLARSATVLEPNATIRGVTIGG